MRFGIVRTLDGKFWINYDDMIHAASGCAVYIPLLLYDVMKLLEAVRRKYPSSFRRERKMLVWIAVWIVVQALYLPV